MYMKRYRLMLCKTKQNEKTWLFQPQNSGCCQLTADSEDLNHYLLKTFKHSDGTTFKYKLFYHHFFLFFGLYLVVSMFIILFYCSKGMFRLTIHPSRSGSLGSLHNKQDTVATFHDINNRHTGLTSCLMACCVPLPWAL